MLNCPKLKVCVCVSFAQYIDRVHIWRRLQVCGYVYDDDENFQIRNFMKMLACFSPFSTEPNVWVIKVIVNNFI